MILDRSDCWLVFFGGARRHATVLALQAAGHRIAAVLVPVRQSPALSESIEKLIAAGMEVRTVDRFGYDAVSREFAHCNLVSVGFPYLLSPECLSRHPAAINVHPTLLPKYRGPTSGAHILINGERESGATVHFMTADADRGAVLAQERVLLSPFDTLRSMQRKTYAVEGSALVKAAERVVAGDCGEPQDEEAATEYPRLRKPADSQIDPREPLVALIDQIRACDPEDFPAFFFHHGEKLCVRLWRPDRAAGEEDAL